MSKDAFPTDIKNCMKECILSILWAKKDIYDFFRHHGCSSSELYLIKNFREASFGRVRMVDLVFSSLSERADGGLGQFRAMLKALIEWSHFDPYYFDTLGKLDRQASQRKLDHLRQLVEIRDARVQEQQRERQRRETELKHNQTATRRANLLDRFVKLHAGLCPPQRRGYALEGLLQDLGALEGLEMTVPFQCAGEQIDGGLKYEGENYIIEAKWQDRSASTEPLYAFAYKVEGKMYGRGIFISINGFSPGPVRALVNGKSVRTILVDGEDLMLALEGRYTLPKMLDVKIRAAQMRGEIYVHPIENAPKIR